MKDLNRLSGDISYLLDLSSNNTVSKLKESSISLARNEANIIYALSDTEENKSIFGGVLEVNGNPFFDFKFTDSEQFSLIYLKTISKMLMMKIHWLE